MADITSLVNYYKNLLIIQYTTLPKAEATIGLIAQTVLADGLVTDIQNAYFIDTAIGVQLDVVGKYQGVDRYFSQIVLQDYFAMVNASEASSLPTSPPAFGFTTAADFADFDYNGTLKCDDVITVENALSDTDFRTLIKLAIRNNNCNYSAGQVDQNLYGLFGMAIRRESNGHMRVVYFFAGSPTTLFGAIIQKGLLPRAMGMNAVAVTGIYGLMFSFATAAGYESPFGFGFSTCADYDSLNGQVLLSSQISEA